MGFRWRKSFSIFPGFRLNLSHRGIRGQAGASPLSLSFRLFGGSKQKRLTASLPGTGLSFVATSSGISANGDTDQPAAINAHALLREALIQAGQMRLVEVPFDSLSAQPAEVRREIVKLAMPRFVELLKANGAQQVGPLASPDAVDEFDDAKIARLIAEVQDAK